MPDEIITLRKSITTKSVESTIDLGRLIGETCRSGDVICLNGDLGTGKTHLVKGIASALLISPDDISSPTFSLIAEHLQSAFPLYHMDAYRIVDLSELTPIGFDDYLDRDYGIFVIEWSDLIQARLPDNRLVLALSHFDEITLPDSRLIEFAAFGHRAQDHLSAILEQWAKLIPTSAK